LRRSSYLLIYMLSFISGYIAGCVTVDCYMLEPSASGSVVLFIFHLRASIIPTSRRSSMQHHFKVLCTKLWMTMWRNFPARSNTLQRFNLYPEVRCQLLSLLILQRKLWLRLYYTLCLGISQPGDGLHYLSLFDYFRKICRQSDICKYSYN